MTYERVKYPKRLKTLKIKLEGVQIYDPRKKKMVHSNNPALIFYDICHRIGHHLDPAWTCKMADWCEEENVGLDGLLVELKEKP